jgi:hypothetical protein
MGLAGQCRRFPQVITKAGSDWCGEHSPALTAGLPILDMMTEGLDKPKDAGDYPKKRGRRPRIDHEATP